MITGGWGGRMLLGIATAHGTTGQAALKRIHLEGGSLPLVSINSLEPLKAHTLELTEL